MKVNYQELYKELRKACVDYHSRTSYIEVREAYKVIVAHMNLDVVQLELDTNIAAVDDFHKSVAAHMRRE